KRCRTRANAASVPVASDSAVARPATSTLTKKACTNCDWSTTFLNHRKDSPRGGNPSVDSGAKAAGATTRIGSARKASSAATYQPRMRSARADTADEREVDDHDAERGGNQQHRGRGAERPVDDDQDLVVDRGGEEQDLAAAEPPRRDVGADRQAE